MLLDRNNMGQIKKLTKALGLYKLYVLKNSFSVFITKIQKRKTRKYLNEVTTYLVNEAKWKAAHSFCKERKWNFQIITEHELARK